jgi:1,2-diacylglycerol 3-alpha-glucosyltransferase
MLYSETGSVIPKVNTIKDTMIYGMCFGFVSLGHRVTLIAAECYQPGKEESYDFEVLFFKIQWRKILPLTLIFSKDTYSYIKKNSDQYDMILSSEVFTFHSLFAAMLSPQKTVIWQELTVHQKKFFRIPSKIWHHTIVPLFIRKVRVVIGRSQPAIKFISQYMNNVSDIPVDHGVNLDKFKTSASKKRQFISSSQLIYRKNMDGIIRKFSNFIKIERYSDFQLYIAGRGPMEDELKQLVKELNIENNVQFVGFLPHMKLSEYISESYAFLINTRQDLNMVSIPESIVSGTPVLTNTIPVLASFISENKLGIVKDDWGPEEMGQMIENGEYIENCKAFRDELSTKRSAEKIVQIFENYNNLFLYRWSMAKACYESYVSPIK